MAFEPGQVIDQYRLDQTIHRGHATIVYSATDLGLGRKVAFKVLTERYSADPSIRQRFVAEAQIAASLDGHPHIVTVYKWGQFEDSMYFVTELIDGISLAELLGRQPGGEPIQPAEALVLLQQVAEAIDFAHKRGAIHRDVKPANVMVKMTEVPRSAYLVDFGITKMGDGDHTNTVGMFLGTPDYASPEQISGAQALDRRADVYSLACTAFHALTGRPPYGDAPNDAARIAAHLQSPIPRATALRPELPAGVDVVLAKALAKDRDERYSSCSEFVRDLRAAFPTSASEFKRALPPGAGLPVPSLYGPEEPPVRKWPWVALGVVVAALATTMVFLLTDGQRNPEVTTLVDPDVSTSTSTTTTSTTSTSTTTTSTTTTTPTTTTVATNAFGFVPGEEVTSADGPESEFALAVQGRQPIPTDVAERNTKTMLYAEWVRLIGVADPGPVIAGDDGFLIDADVEVELQDFVVEAGQVVGFEECSERCAGLDQEVALTPECEPAEGCPTVVSETGDLRAFQRATITFRFPAQSLVYEIVTDRNVASITEPSRTFYFDPESRYFAAVFPGEPDPGTTHVLTITYDDSSTDELRIRYNAAAPG